MTSSSSPPRGGTPLSEDGRYPALAPHTTRLVAPDDSAILFVEESGAPDGIPVVWLHGGPGSGLGSGGYRRMFDPARYRIIGLDQRGCGRSIPLVTEDLAGIHVQTTATLIADLEAAREQLGVDRWVVTGGSWGSTLALAYALAHPERVLGVILGAITTTSRAEVDWITETVGRLFPEAWRALDAASGRRPGERLIEAYARRLADPSPAAEADRAAAADAWDAWESTHVSLDPAWTPGPAVEDPSARRVFVTLTTRYWAHDAFLGDEQAIIPRLGALAGIPGVLVHGRHDVSGPAVTALAVHEAWPGSVLEIVESEGHGGPEMSRRMRAAADDLAARLRPGLPQSP